MSPADTLRLQVLAGMAITLVGTAIATRMIPLRRVQREPTP